MTREEKIAIDLFAEKWKQSTGYGPAVFQKAIALQRISRGQSIEEIIIALTAQRV